MYVEMAYKKTKGAALEKYCKYEERFVISEKLRADFKFLKS